MSYRNKSHRHGKKNNGKISRAFLKERASRCIEAGFPKQKWVIFCETLLDAGYDLRLYEATNTYSKYITIFLDKKQFKVRFSNHKPIPHRELQGDCDFFVGVTNLGVTTTSDALRAIYNHFKKKEGAL